MKEKFTLVYTEYGRSNIKRVEKSNTETMLDVLNKHGLANACTHIFVGWPLLRGEEPNGTQSSGDEEAHQGTRLT